MIPLKQKLEYFFDLIDKEYMFYCDGHFWWEYRLYGRYKTWCKLKEPQQVGTINNKGYRVIGGMIDKDGFLILEHHLIYAYFYGINKLVKGRKIGLEINHIDTIKYNNSPKNLELVTGKVNIKHSYDNGLQISLKGECNPMVKLTDEKVLKIRKLLKIGEYTQKMIGDMFKVGITVISNIQNRKAWAHI